MAIFLFFVFGQGEGHFYLKVNYFSFSPGGGGSPLLGEKRAFLAEPSARPAINGRLDEMWGCTNEKKNKNNNNKKNGRKSAYLCVSTRSEDFSPVGRSRRDEKNGRVRMAAMKTFFEKNSQKLGPEKTGASQRLFIV